MTNDEINKAITDKVFNGKYPYMVTETDDMTGELIGFGGPQYSTNISAAWQVVEKMREKGYMYDLFDCYEDTETHGCTFMIPVEPEIDEIVACEHAPTAPMAICLAALKAVS